MAGHLLTLQQVQHILAEYAPGIMIPRHQSAHAFATRFPEFSGVSVVFYDGVFNVKRVYSLDSLIEIKKFFPKRRSTYGVPISFEKLLGSNDPHLQPTFTIENEFGGDGNVVVTKATGIFFAAYSNSSRGERVDLTGEYLVENKMHNSTVGELSKTQVRLFNTLLCSAVQRMCFDVTVEAFPAGSHVDLLGLASGYMAMDVTTDEIRVYTKPNSNVVVSDNGKQITATHMINAVILKKRGNRRSTFSMVPPWSVPPTEGGAATHRFHSSPYRMVPPSDWRIGDPTNPEASFVVQRNEFAPEIVNYFHREVAKVHGSKFPMSVDELRAILNDGEQKVPFGRKIGGNYLRALLEDECPSYMQYVGGQDDMVYYVG